MKNQPERILLTDKVLHLLGFSDAWGGCGDWSERRLSVEHQDGGGSQLELWQYDEKPDDTDGYARDGVYVDGYTVVSFLRLWAPGSEPAAKRFLGQQKIACAGQRIDFLHELLDVLRQPEFPPQLLAHVKGRAVANKMHRAISDEQQ